MSKRNKDKEENKWELFEMTVKASKLYSFYINNKLKTDNSNVQHLILFPYSEHIGT